MAKTRTVVRWTIVAAAILVSAILLIWFYFVRPSGRYDFAELFPPSAAVSAFPKEFGQRLHTVRQKLDSRPTAEQALADLAKLDLANGFTKQAESALRLLLQRETSNPRWSHYLAGLLANQGRTEEAIRYWTEVVSLNPEYTPAQLKLADALKKTNQRDAAIQIYLKLLQREPNNAAALVGLAVMDVDSGDWSSARERTIKAINADNTFWAAFNLLVTIADHFGESELRDRAKAREKELGRYREPPDPWQDELVDLCFDPPRLRVLASTAGLTGQTKDALRLAERADQLSPNDPDTLRLLGEVYLALHDLKSAEKALRSSISLDPKVPKSYLLLENVFRETQDIKAARELLQQALKFCGDDASLNYEYALVLIAQGDIKASIGYLEVALGLTKDNPDIFQKLSIAYSRLGQNRRALEIAEEGLRLMPRDPPLVVLRGRYAVESGDALEAREYFRRAKNLHASNEDLDAFANLFRSRFGFYPQ